MNRNKQSGFAIVEAFIILVVLAGLVGGGYFVWQRDRNAANPSADAGSAKLNYDSPPVTTASAPVVTTTSDLNTALNTLDQTNVTAASTDNAQLGVQASGF